MYRRNYSAETNHIWGNKSIRVYSEESAGAKIFVEFVAMIVRCKMYIKLKEEMKKLDRN